MTKSDESADTDTGTLALDALVADILAGSVSAFELMRSAPRGDYWAFVQMMRLSRVLMSDRRIAAHLLQELRSKMVEAGVDPDDPAIEKELTRKDGARRFPKLVEARVQAFNTQPSLLTGATFEARLEQYKTLIAHVEKLWADACELYVRANFPIAAFLSILVIEEVGKLSRLAEELVYSDAPRNPTPTVAVERSHRRKHFIAVVSGALINARLDRVLGKDVVRKILHEAESDELERARQSCLYIDLQNGRAVTPGDRIGEDRARTLTVLAGELMAEVLGHFPWEFERMLENVIAFERAIGLPEAKITGQPRRKSKSVRSSSGGARDEAPTQ